jgi:tetratricopeptide (TPR) repeat protein
MRRRERPAGFPCSGRGPGSSRPDPPLVAEPSSEYEKVISTWRSRSIDLEREAYVKALVNQCNVLIQTEELRRALEICRAAVDTDLQSAVNYYNLAGIYALMGRIDEALDSLERDLELGDTDWMYLESAGSSRSGTTHATGGSWTG